MAHRQGLGSGFPLRLLILLFMLISLPWTPNSQGRVVGLDTSFEEPVSSGLGGRTLLVEEVTATWCPTCASIDPELFEVADSHGSRIALIALHPSDGEDAFQPEASQQRIERLKTIQSDVANSTPTFVVESGTPRKGYDAWDEVQRDILNTELTRQSTSQLEFEVIKTEEGYRASITTASLIEAEGSQLTFMLLEHEKQMPEGAINPGGDSRDRVLVGLAECNVDNNTITSEIGFLGVESTTGCASSLIVEFAEMDSWSLILIH
ncbi:MAG: thioredoxin family protein, partial [Candidatus Poseidonia sp.]|nr:thioredoxin family protein [Poseidonia sp.]